MNKAYQEYQNNLIEFLRSYTSVEYGWHEQEFFVSTYGYGFGCYLIHLDNCTRYAEGRSVLRTDVKDLGDERVIMRSIFK